MSLNVKPPNRPTQAVILAGGRGTRLAPLTNSRPKPMIEFHGRPFLQYLIEILRDQGFLEILILLGYLPEKVQEHFGDGKRFGVHIRYLVSDVEDDTGRRLRLAKSMIDPIFLLLYCDNYWPMNFEEMWNQYCSEKVLAQVTVYRNQDRYTRDNVKVDEKGYLTIYDKSRTVANLSGVDIGFVLFRKEVLDLIPDSNVMFEREVYPQLASRRQMKAFWTNHRYYSVGSMERLPFTADFLARHPAVILDRDGVLNRKPSRARYVRSWEEWEWLPGAQEAVRLFTKAGYKLFLVSNQAGIGRGEMAETDLTSIHEQMQKELQENGGRIDDIYYCPHNWNDGCDCRKPKPGMLFRVQHEHNVDLSRTCFIGDDERDIQAAKAAGCPSILVSDQRSLLETARELLKSRVSKGE